MTEIADIFRKYSTEYMNTTKLPFSTYKTIHAIEACRTAQLGGHVDECNDCGHIRISYNSCRNRHCPKCQGLTRERWIENRVNDLLPIPYFHIVFTIPADLNPLVLRNKKTLYSILFKASSETLLKLAKDEKYLGAQIGFISVLHTWGQNLMDHPHIHCIATGGGLSSDKTQWLSTRKNFFLPVKVMSSLFRGKFMYYLKQEIRKEKVQFPGEIQNLKNSDDLQKLIDKLYSQNWVVYSKAPFKSAKNVLKYLGRYTHRIAISNQRITKFENGQVTFKWKDYADNNTSKFLVLDALEFIRRFLLHILPDGFMKIRYYGLMSNKNRKTLLQKCKLLLGVLEDQSQLPQIKEPWQELLLRLTGVDITICPCCSKGKMVSIRTLPPLGKGTRKAVA